MFKVNYRKIEHESSDKEKEEFIPKLYNTVALFFDERSVIA
jgi:hypothetical protein